MSEHLIEKPDFDVPKMFRAMADRIERNDAAEFAGAFLIVGPTGEPIDGLMVGSKADLGAFWGLVKTKVEIEVNMLTEKDRASRTAGGWR